MTVENILTIVFQTIALLGVLIGAYIKLMDRINRVSERIVRMETVWDMFGEKAAKILHRDDDAYGVDSLLNKYLDKHYDLSMPEWNQLHEAMERVANNPDIPKSERTLAAFLSALAVHKMASYIQVANYGKAEKKAEKNER